MHEVGDRFRIGYIVPNECANEHDASNGKLVTASARRTQSSPAALDRKPEYECDPCEESGVRRSENSSTHLSKQVLVDNTVRGELVDIANRSLRSQRRSAGRTHHDAADGLARELEHTAQERELLIRQLILYTKSHERFQLGLAIRDTVVVCAEQIIQHLLSAWNKWGHSCNGATHESDRLGNGV